MDTRTECVHQGLLDRSLGLSCARLLYLDEDAGLGRGVAEGKIDTPLSDVVFGPDLLGVMNLPIEGAQHAQYDSRRDCSFVWKAPLLELGDDVVESRFE